MVSMAGSYYVYFRCWPGFTDAFPYEKFGSLPDDEVLVAVHKAINARLWERRDMVRKIRSTELHKLKEAIRLQSQKILGPRRSNLKNKKTLREFRKPRTKLGKFFRLAKYAGWHKGRGWVLITLQFPHVFG
jgi:hypothetical protein